MDLKDTSRVQNDSGMALGSPFLSAVKWSYVANWGERSFGALFTFVLAALLGPRDFGIVAIGMAYVLFFQMFLDQGFLAALIQKSDLEPEHLDSVFWMDLLLSVILMGLSLWLSEWWALRTHSPGSGRVFGVLSICIPIEGLAAVQGAVLKKQMDFRTIAIRTNVAALAGGGVGLGMAFRGFGIWSLVGQQVTRDLIALWLLWKLSDWRPRVRFSWSHLKSLTGFSVANFTAQLGSFAEAQSSSLLLGIFFGPAAVGLYRIAERLTNSIVSMATASIQAVSLPQFSRLQKHPEELARSVLLCVRWSAALVLPILGIMAVSSDRLMAVVGSKWIPAEDALRLLCVLGMCSVFAHFTGPLLQAASKTRLLAALEWGRTGASVCLVTAAGILVQDNTIKSQVTAIALTRTILGACIATPLFLAILIRTARLRWQELASAVAPSILSAVSAAVGVELFRLIAFTDHPGSLLFLIADFGAGAAAGCAALVVMDPGLRRSVLGAVRGFLGAPGLPPG
jgi:PST family polysaccharide transporter